MMATQSPIGTETQGSPSAATEPSSPRNFEEVLLCSMPPPTPHHPTRLEDIAEEEDPFAAYVNSFVKREGELKWRCQIQSCRMIFFRQELWGKHVATRHREWLKECEKKHPRAVNNGRVQEDSGQDHEKKGEELHKDVPQEEIDDASSTWSWEAVPEPGNDEVGESTPETQQDKPEARKDPRRQFLKAAASGDVEVLERALERGVHIDVRTSKGVNALVLAIRWGHVEAVEFLLKKGADPYLRVRNMPPLIHAILGNRNAPQIITLLREHGVDLNTVAGPLLGTALHWAAGNDADEVAEFLIEEGMDMEERDDDECTPLVVAAEAGATATAAVLLKHGANIKACSKGGGNVLAWSSWRNHTDTVKFWLDQGVPIDIRDKLGLSALHLACYGGCVETAALLLERGANPSVLSKGLDKESPLMAAARSNSIDILNQLLLNDADVDLKNSSGQTALDVAIVEYNLEAAQVLLEAMSRGSYNPKDSVSLRMALAKGPDELNQLICASSLMYPYVGFKFETPGKLAWMEWVLNEGGALVKPRAMLNLLRFALDGGDVEMVSELINQGCEINIILPNHHSPLSMAVEGRNIPLIELLLKAGADPNLPGNSDQKYTPFDFAIIGMKDGTDTEIVNVLLQSERCHINQGPDPVATAFSYVLRVSEKEGPLGPTNSLAIRMVDSVKDVNGDRCATGCTLLHVAALYGGPDMIDYLLHKGAEINATNASGHTPFHYACQRSPKLLPLLVARGADVHAKFDPGCSALFSAAAHGSTESLEFLIEQGLDLNVETGRGFTPLACALGWGKEEIALRMMELGATVDWQTKETGQTALHYAAGESLESALEQLLTKRLNVNARDLEGFTPLHEACLKGTPKIVEMLLDAGADIDAEVPFLKHRPLHLAIANKREAIVSLLLERGADITVRTARSQSMLYFAVRCEHVDTVRALLDRGASTEDITAETWTPLCSSQSPEITRLLIARGANVNYRDEDDWTPLHQAVYNEDLVKAEMLLLAGADMNVRTTDQGRTVEDMVCDFESEEQRSEFFGLFQRVKEIRAEAETDKDKENDAGIEVHEEADIVVVGRV